MEDRILTFELVTPCFLGGAFREGPAEWRAGSVRGQLRWWFRAVAGGRCNGDLEEVRRLEAEIFGTTDRSSSLRVRTLGTPRTFPTGTACTDGRSLGAEEIAAMWADSAAGTASRLRLLNPRGTAFPVNPIHYLAYGPVAPSSSGVNRIALRSPATCGAPSRCRDGPARPTRSWTSPGRGYLRSGNRTWTLRGIETWM